MFSHAVLAPPAQLAVDLDLIRAHCRVNQTYEDALLSLYADAATALVESYTCRALLTQTLRLVSTGTLPPTSIALSNGPLIVYPLEYSGFITGVNRRIEMLRSPLISVLSVSVTRQDGTTEVLDPSNYQIDRDTAPGAILLIGFTLLPSDRMVVDYTAGYGPVPADVPSPLKNAILWLTGYMYAHRGDDEINEMPSLMRRLCDPYRIFFFGSISADGR